MSVLVDFEEVRALVRGPDGKWIGASVPIHSHTLAELKRYDIGRIDPAAKYAQQYPEQKPVDGERFPTLAEFFAAVGPDVRFNIEIKTDPTKPDLTVEPDRFAQLAVDGMAQLFDLVPLLFGVRLGDARRFPHARHFHVVLEVDLGLVHGAGDRRRADGLRRARQRDVAFAGQQARGGIEADPACTG